jgi:hypothetical protein
MRYRHLRLRRIHGGFIHVMLAQLSKVAAHGRQEIYRTDQDDRDDKTSQDVVGIRSAGPTERARANDTKTRDEAADQQYPLESRA